MENQAQQTPSIDPLAEKLADIINTVINRIETLIDKRVSDTLQTQATAALFNDALEAKIRGIAAEEAQDKIDELDLDDAVRTAIGDFDMHGAVERTFKNHVNWEEKVSDQVDELLDNKIEAEIDNVLEDKIDEMLEDKLEEKIREVLINIIKGE